MKSRPSPSGEGTGVGAVVKRSAQPLPHPNPSPEGEGLTRAVTLAVIIGAHGVTGEVRLKLFAESLDGLTAHKRFNEGVLTLKSARLGPSGPIARFAEIDDRNAADALRGTELTVPRDALPALAEGEYYHADLIGLPCRSATGEPLGRVVAVENFGAGDILEIETPEGKRAMVPFRPGIADLIDEGVIVDSLFVT